MISTEGVFLRGIANTAGDSYLLNFPSAVQMGLFERKAEVGEEAVKHARRAMRLMPRSYLHWIMHFTAMALQLPGNADEAKTLFEIIMAANPSSFWQGCVHQQMALIEAARGNDDRARRTFPNPRCEIPCPCAILRPWIPGSWSSTSWTCQIGTGQH